ncbi:hypothetical protein I3760_04G130900 [Carya illinoinensis]|nr:hypothetical protein I3760_04G130900 [Carya illinoinensis]
MSNKKSMERKAKDIAEAGAGKRELIDASGPNVENQNVKEETSDPNPLSGDDLLKWIKESLVKILEKLEGIEPHLRIKRER